MNARKIAAHVASGSLSWLYLAGAVVFVSALAGFVATAPGCVTIQRDGEEVRAIDVRFIEREVRWATETLDDYIVSFGDQHEEEFIAQLELARDEMDRVVRALGRLPDHVVGVPQALAESASIALALTTGIDGVASEVNLALFAARAVLRRLAVHLDDDPDIQGGTFPEEALE